jgi:hypothetical protein
MKTKKKQKVEIAINKDGFIESLLPPPIIEIYNENIEAAHYNDLSGSIEIIHGGEQIFCAESGKMQHQIADLRKAIIEKEKGFAKSIEIMKAALSALERGLEIAKKAIKDNKKTSSKSPKTTMSKHHRDDCYCKDCYAGSYH